VNGTSASWRSLKRIARRGQALIVIAQIPVSVFLVHITRPTIVKPEAQRGATLLISAPAIPMPTASDCRAKTPAPRSTLEFTPLLHPNALPNFNRQVPIRYLRCQATIASRGFSRNNFPVFHSRFACQISLSAALEGYRIVFNAYLSTVKVNFPVPKNRYTTFDLTMQGIN
jgi:hypothetical protein